MTSTFVNCNFLKIYNAKLSLNLNSSCRFGSRLSLLYANQLDIIITVEQDSWGMGTYWPVEPANFVWRQPAWPASDHYN